jgi:hypothetical protein
MPASWSIHANRLRIGTWVDVSFQRTRLVDAGPGTPPQSYGAVPVAATHEPSDGDVAIGLRMDEGLWLAFEPLDAPVALRVAAGNVDAVTGRAWSESMSATPQNYVVVPPQTALDGVQVGSDHARPFSALRRECADGACVTLRLIAIPHVPTLPPTTARAVEPVQPLRSAGRETGDDASHGGGVVPQTIVRDPHGLAVWDVSRAASARVAILTPEVFTKLTGAESLPAIRPEDGYKGWRLP